VNQFVQVKKVVWGDPDFDLAIAAEYQVFGVANHFVNAGDVAAGEMLIYKPYERFSEFYLAQIYEEHGWQTVGVARFIRHDPEKGLDSFSTLKDGRSYSYAGGPPRNYLTPSWLRFFEQADPAAIGELATQAIAPPFRGPRMIGHLWLAMSDAGRAAGVLFWTMALVVPLYRVYQRRFPKAMSAIGETMPNYVGADSVPAVLQLSHPEAEAYRDRLARECNGACPLPVTVRAGLEENHP
jgi:hypothetical protein